VNLLSLLQVLKILFFQSIKSKKIGEVSEWSLDLEVVYVIYDGEA